VGIFNPIKMPSISGLDRFGGRSRLSRACHARLSEFLLPVWAQPATGPRWEADFCRRDADALHHGSAETDVESRHRCARMSPRNTRRVQRGDGPGARKHGWTHPGMETYYRNARGRVVVNSPYCNATMA
jgi:hypothetical protein